MENISNPKQTILCSEDFSEIRLKGHSMYFGVSNIFIRAIYEEGKLSTYHPYSGRCGICGETIKLNIVESVGKHILVAEQEQCAFENVKTTTHGVSFPSGKIVVADTIFHEGFGPEPSEELDYNTLAAQIAYMDFYAENGLIYGPVGNTSPSLVKHEGKLKIVESCSGDWCGSDEFVDEGGEDKCFACSNGCEQLASICTDLWAYSIMDYDAFIATSPSEEVLAHVKVVDVEPGVYSFEHFFADDYHYTKVFAVGEKVR